MKKLVLLLDTILLCCLLSACACKHNWNDATCTEAKKCTNCGETEGETTGHDFEIKDTKPATCSERGVITRVCKKCGLIEEERTDKEAHVYGEPEIVRNPGCTEKGEQVTVCVNCGKQKTKDIAATGHSYGELTTVVSATCTQDGKCERACTICGEKNTVTEKATGHKDGGNGICSVCGVELPLVIEMSDGEISKAKSVYYMGDKSIQHNDGKFTLLFSLQDVLKEKISSPCLVKIRIVNKDNETVYTGKKIVRTSDFGYWTSALAGERYLASVTINDTEITNGSNSSGTIYFSVENDGYFYFEETSLSIFDELPVSPVTVELPALPLSVNKKSYNGSIRSTCTINNITYEVNGSYMTIYFEGVKTADVNGNNNSDSCIFSWKIYDNDNYVIGSGNVFTSDLVVGEKFKDEKAYIYNIKAGGKYRLQISDYE